MNREILNDYREKEDKILLAQVLDKIEMVEKKNKIEYTDFLDLAQFELVQKFINKIKIENCMSYGGFEEAERKIFVFYPEKFNSIVVEKNLTNIVQIIRIELPDDLKGKYTHRDYLGAVIKLGIERKKVGDIVVDSNGADIIVDKDILKFLLENLGGLTRFSKSTITVENIENLRPVEIKKEEIEIIVSSMRLDNVISELARCSRNKALDIINQERVLVNFECETKKTKQIKPGDMLTIRGKGRFFVKEISGQTRSGRFVIKVEKFV
jgi:RNA-binding protein YlmH